MDCFYLFVLFVSIVVVVFLFWHFVEFDSVCSSFLSFLSHIAAVTNQRYFTLGMLWLFENHHTQNYGNDNKSYKMSGWVTKGTKQGGRKEINTWHHYTGINRTENACHKKLNCTQQEITHRSDSDTETECCTKEVERLEKRRINKQYCKEYKATNYMTDLLSWKKR